MSERIKDRCPDFLTVDDAISMDYETVKELQGKHLNKLRVELGDGQYFVKSEGYKCIDQYGRECIDMVGGVAVNAVGANNPFIWGELTKVFESKQYNFGAVAYHNLASAFAHNMAQLSPGGKLTKMGTATGGAEANEALLKLIKIACRNKPEKTRLLAADNAFHGKTTGAVSLGGKELWRMWQHPLMETVDHVPFGDADAFEEAIATGQYMAVWLEPIQGEGGVNIPPEGFFKRVREACDKYDTYLVVDEIQMGCGRTGKLWAIEWEDIIPDAMAFGKSFTGGIVPFTGFICTEELYNAAYGSPETCYHHTATFQEGSYMAAAGLATLEFLLDNNLIEQAHEKGEFFREKCRRLIDKYPGVLKDVRGRGLIIGFETYEVPEDRREAYGNETFANPLVADLVDNLQVEALTAINSTTVFRMSPALTIDKETLSIVADRLEIAVKNAYEAVYGA